MTKSKLFLTSIFAIAIFFSFAVASSSSDSSSNSEVATNNKTELPTVGQNLQTEYFLVTLNGVTTDYKINTGNPFSDLKADPGNKFLIFNVTFKNTDKESRMLMDGSVFIEYNNTRYEFDNPETIMAEGWGLMLEQINPLTSKTTNLVYKIPEEISGDAFWNPGRSNKNKIFYLGAIGATSK